MSKNSEHTAYPIFDKYGNAGYDKGLTKREYYAGIALQGILSNDRTITAPYNMEVIVKESIRAADELLKQLDNE